MTRMGLGTPGPRAMSHNGPAYAHGRGTQAAGLSCVQLETTSTAHRGGARTVTAANTRSSMHEAVQGGAASGMIK